MKKLAGRVAVVTGSSKGIGAGIAKALAAEGASVVVNYASSKAGADAVVDAISAAGGKALAVRADISIAVEAQALIESAVTQFGRLDILVNNTGVWDVGAVEARHRGSVPSPVRCQCSGHDHDHTGGHQASSKRR